MLMVAPSQQPDEKQKYLPNCRMWCPQTKKKKGRRAGGVGTMNGNQSRIKIKRTHTHRFSSYHAKFKRLLYHLTRVLSSLTNTSPPAVAVCSQTFRREHTNNKSPEKEKSKRFQIDFFHFCFLVVHIIIFGTDARFYFTLRGGMAV